MENHFRATQLPTSTRLDERRRVNYLHHTRDSDGNVILYFSLPPSVEVYQSSAVRGIARLDLGATGPGGYRGRARYVVSTENSAYEVEMPLATADHLAVELGQ
jgi:hypothetical protein